jgi:hypothetical protein
MDLLTYKKRKCKFKLDKKPYMDSTPKTFKKKGTQRLPENNFM